MLKTYRNHLSEIEGFYNNKDYGKVIVETAKLIEKAVDYLFHNFNITLKDESDVEKYLEFERNNIEKYTKFLDKPTLGIAIGFLNQLLKVFPNHPNIHPDLKRYLERINNIRNQNVHAVNEKATDGEAADILDASENFLKITGLLDRPTEEIGFPLKYYLVYRSIERKFNESEDQGDFRKIVNDANELIPKLLDIYLNRIYTSTDIEKKNRLFEVFKKIRQKRSNQPYIFYYDLLYEIEGFGNPAFKENLHELTNEDKSNYTRRKTRHYVIVLEYLIDTLINEKTKPFIEYANHVKKRYLISRKLTSEDKAILEDKAIELGLTQKVVKPIEDTVVDTIDNELTIFQTLEGSQIRNSFEAVKYQSKFRKPVLIGLALLAILVFTGAFLIRPIWLFGNDYGLKDYERYWYEADYEKAYKTSEKHLSLENEKAHYFNIRSISDSRDVSRLGDVDKQLEKLKKKKLEYYRELVRENPQDPRAHVYMGFAYSYLGDYLKGVYDSAWLSFKEAEKLKGSGQYFDLQKLKEYTNYATNAYLLPLVESISKKNKSPIAQRRLHWAYYSHLSDTVNAKKSLKRAIKAYPNYHNALVFLGRIYFDEKMYDSAEYYLDKAFEINSDEEDFLKYYSELLIRQDKLKKLVNFLTGKIDSKRVTPLHYFYLTRCYLNMDSLNIAGDLIDKGEIKYPDNKYIKRALREFTAHEKQQAKNRELLSEDALLPWLIDFNEALNIANTEEKPLLIDFRLPESYMAKYVDRWHYTDTSVQSKLSNYVIVKLMINKNQKLYDKFKKNDDDIFIVDRHQNLLVSFCKCEAYNKEDFKHELDEGLEKFNRKISNELITNNPFTKVSKFSDGMLIAKERNKSLMLIIGDKQSVWTRQLLDGLNDPEYKSDFLDVVYVYLDARDLNLNEGIDSVNIFPTTLFYDSHGILKSNLIGYQKPGVIADKISDIRRGETNSEINWISNFEEGRAIASILKKDLFIQAGRIDASIYSDAELKNYLKDNFICINLEREDKELTRYASTSGWAWGQYYISLNEDYLEQNYFDYSRDIFDWLQQLEKKHLLSVIGSERYQDFNKKLILAKRLSNFGLSRSSIQLFEELIKVDPTNSELYYFIGGIYRFAFSEHLNAINYYSLALEHGKKIDDEIISELVTEFLGAEKSEDCFELLDHYISKKSNSKNELFYLYEGYCFLHMALGEYDKALRKAKEADHLIADSRSKLLLGRYSFLAKNYQLAHLNLEAATSSKDPFLASKAYFYLSVLADSLENSQLSHKYLSQSLNMYSDLGFYYGWYGLYFPKFYNYPGLIDYVEFSLKCNMKYAQASSGEGINWHKRNLALYYVFMNKNLNEAMELIIQAYDNDSDPWVEDLLPIKAWIYHAIGDREKMIETIKELQTHVTNEELEQRIISCFILAENSLSIQDTPKAIYYYNKIKNHNAVWPHLTPVEREIKHRVSNMLKGDEVKSIINEPLI